MLPAESTSRPSERRIFVRVGIFAFLVLAVLMILSPLVLPWAGPLIAGATVSFAAAAIANAVTLRIYERGGLADIGLALSKPAWRNAAIGFAIGVGAVLFVAGIPLLAGLASLQPAPEQPRNWYSLLFITVVLLFGAVGEEMLFRGYGFQLLLSRIGTFATILPMGVLFAWAHSSNPAINWLGYLNTFLWGVLFGLCFLRSGDLWLPIGLHFGWNWAVPLFGINLSGFTMSVTGYTMVWNAGPLWSGGAYGLEGSLLTLFMFPLATWALYLAPIVVSKPYLFREDS